LLTPDKGHARKLVQFEPIQNTEGIRTIGEFSNLTRAMEKVGRPERKTHSIMGENGRSGTNDASECEPQPNRTAAHA
jgi:hypothetical protein